jgi:hypothetical protein
MAQSFLKAGMSEEERWRAAARVRAAFAHASWIPLAKPSRLKSTGPFTWLHDPDVAWLIGVHEWKGDRYFNKEAFEQLLWWISLRPLLDLASAEQLDKEQSAALEDELSSRIRAAARSGYRVEDLLLASKLAGPAPVTDAPKASAEKKLEGEKPAPKKSSKKKEPTKR